MMITDPWFYAAAIPAVILTGLAKGGFAGVGLAAMPLIALVISPIKGAAIILPILVVQDAFGLWVYRRHWDRRNVAILLSGAVVGMVLAALFAAHVTDAAVNLVVGGISLAFGARRLILERGGTVPAKTEARLIPGLIWGAVSGFASMIANGGAPPFQVYVIPQRLERSLFVGTGIVFFAVVNWMKLPAFLALGQFSADTLATSLVLMPLAVVSTWAGVVLVRRVSGERFYRLIYLILVAVGLKLIWDGTAGVAGL